MNYDLFKIGYFINLMNIHVFDLKNCIVLKNCGV
jgi:hypothetical protein